jgi:hypothetical protein
MLGLTQVEHAASALADHVNVLGARALATQGSLEVFQVVSERHGLVVAVLFILGVDIAVENLASSFFELHPQPL